MTKEALAARWRDTLLQAFGVPAGPPVLRRSQHDEEPNPYYRDWVGSKQKWVPILSVANSGVRLGGAQVAGPPVQVVGAPDAVAQVKAVVQVQMSIKSFGGRLYVPVAVKRATSSPARVPGVGVSAVIEFKI